MAEVANENGIPLIDAAEVLRPHTVFGILDYTMFHDHVHPKLRAFFLLGMAAADLGSQLRWLSTFRFDKSRRTREADKCLEWSSRLRNGGIQPGEDVTEALH